MRWRGFFPACEGSSHWEAPSSQAVPVVWPPTAVRWPEAQSMKETPALHPRDVNPRNADDLKRGMLTSADSRSGGHDPAAHCRLVLILRSPPRNYVTWRHSLMPLGLTSRNSARKHATLVTALCRLDLRHATASDPAARADSGDRLGSPERGDGEVLGNRSQVEGNKRAGRHRVAQRLLRLSVDPTEAPLSGCIDVTLRPP